MNKKGKTITSVSALASVSLLVALAAGSCSNKINPYSVNLATDPTGTTITVWTGFGSNINDVMDALDEQFTADTGIKVNYESKGSYDNLKDAVVLAAATGNYPNVTIGYPDHFAEYVQSDIIVRLDYYFEHDAECVGLGTEKEKFPVAMSDYYQQYMTENQSLEFKDDGTPYTLGVPFNKSTEYMTYNASFFSYAQSVDATITVPRTWGEVATVGAKINTIMANINAGGKKYVGSDNKLYQTNTEYPAGVKTKLDFTETDFEKFRPIAYDSQSNLFITELRNWGSTYTTLDKATRKGYLAYNETDTKDKTKASLQAMRELYNNGILGVPKTWEESKYSSNVFKNMNTMMSIGSTAGASNSTPAGGKFECGAAPVPYNAGNQKYVISQGTNLCLLDKGSEAERVASWVYLKYFSKYCNGEFAAETGYFPACEYAQNSDAYQAFLTRTGGSDVEKLKRDVAKVNTDFYGSTTENWEKFVDAPFVGSAYVRTQVAAIPENVMFTTKDLQTILDDSYAALNAYVKK